MSYERVCEQCAYEVACQTPRLGFVARRLSDDCPQCGADLTVPTDGDGLTRAERERIEADPVLSIDDIREGGHA